MREYKFVFKGSVRSGQTLFEIRNDGKLDHTFTLYLLPEDMPPIDQQLRGPVRRPVTSAAHVPLRKPGQSERFVYDLKPGQRYAMICFVIDPDGVNHASKGMSADLRPPGPPPDSAPSDGAPPPQQSETSTTVS